MSKVTTASIPDGLLDALSSELKQIPAISALNSSDYQSLLNSLQDAVGFRIADIDWHYGKAGKCPDVTGPILMHDIERAFYTAGITATAWNDTDTLGSLPAGESDLFKVYRCTNELIKKYTTPKNLKHIYKNSKKIK